MAVSNNEDFQDMVRQFNQAVDAKPDIELRVKLIQEEAEEFIEAIKSENIIETIDALCDLAYVAYGAADIFNLQLDTQELSTIIIEAKPLNWVTLHSDLVLSDFNEAVSDVVMGLRGRHINLSFSEGFNRRYTKSALEDLIIGIWEFAAQGLAINLGPFFQEVHRTNMHKLKGPKREDGKQLKPEGWKPPRIKALYNRMLSKVAATCKLNCPLAKAYYIRPHPEGGYICDNCEGLIASIDIENGFKSGSSSKNENKNVKA